MKLIFVVHYSSLLSFDLNIEHEHSHRCIIVTFLRMRNMTRTHYPLVRTLGQENQNHAWINKMLYVLV